MPVKYEKGLMPASHIQRSPAEFVYRQKVAEFQNRRGVERIFRWKPSAINWTGIRRSPLNTCQ